MPAIDSTRGQPLEARWFGPPPATAPSIVMVHDDDASGEGWGDFPNELVRATGCGVFSYRRTGRGSMVDSNTAACEELAGALDAAGFERGILLGHGAGAAIATIYLGGVADHRVRGLVLENPRFFDDGGVDPTWDIRESISYIRVPIQIVRGDGPGASTAAHVHAAEEEAYCPVDVATIPGAGSAPHLDRPAPTLAAIAEFVNTLFVAAGEAAGFPLAKARHGR